MGMVRRRGLLENWCWVDVPRTRRLRLLLLLLITESLSSNGRRVLLTIVVVVARRQASILMMMITVLVRLILILIHRLDVVVVLPNCGRRLARHPLESTTLSRWAVGLDVGTISLIASILIIARVWTDSFSIMTVAVHRWSIVHHVGIAMRR